jgi:ABC-type multidrug transport system fused ATPase/permease subunit
MGERAWFPTLAEGAANSAREGEMWSLITTVVALLTVVAMIVSTVRFALDSRKGARTRRQLAAISAAMTLVIVAMLYSGWLVGAATASVRYLGLSVVFRHDVYSALHAVDLVCTDAVNAISRALSARPVAHRFDPPAWPAVLLWVGYLARFLIHRFHRRPNNEVSALTGSVYLAHVTTCAMAVAFLIVELSWRPLVVVPTTLLVTAALVVSVKVLLEDLVKSIAAFIHTAITELGRAGQNIALAAAEGAALVRWFLAFANKAYLTHVRAPLRRQLKRLDDRNAAVKDRTAKRLKKQDARHTSWFGSE